MFPSPESDTRKVPLTAAWPAAAGAHLVAPIVEPRAASIVPVLQNIADEVRLLIGAHQAIVRVAADESWTRVLSAVSVSEKYLPGAPADFGSEPVSTDWSRYRIQATLRVLQSDHAVYPARPGMGNGASHPAIPGRLAAPLFSRDGRNIGAIELTDKLEADFTPGDETNLARFARIASLAVENACLYQQPPGSGTAPAQSRSGVELEVEIGRILARSGEIGALLQDSADAIVRHTGVALVRIWQSRGGVLELQGSAGLSVQDQDQRARVPVGQFSIGHVARIRRLYLTNCIQSDSHIHDKEWARRQGLTAFAGLPLVCAGELMGVLAVYHHQPILPSVFEAVASLSSLIAMTILRHRKDDEADSAKGAAGLSLAGDLCTQPAVIVTSPDGAIVDWNPGAQRSFGYLRDDILGLPCTILIPPDRADEHQAILNRIAAGETVSLPETVRLRDGGRPINVSLTVSGLHDTAGRFIGAVTVVHELAEFQRLEEKYRQAQKMGVFGQLAGGVAHDFNNLLTIILGYTEIIIRRLAPSDSLRDLLAEIQKATQRAETLTRQLLAFSRKQTLEPKVLDLNTAVAETEKMLRRLIGEDVLLTSIFASGLKPVKLDPGHLQQVILNLAVNARDAMPEGGRLTIETSRAVLDEADASAHPHAHAGEFVKLSITDTGIGMDGPTLARLFEPLFTTKDPGKGTGLGLATVHGIVRQAGGHIDVASELGHGSSFHVYFPAVLEPLSIGQAHSNLRLIPRGKETVLVVEDDTAVRSVVREVLLTCGYTVLEATNGEEALQLARGFSEPIHLLVADVVLPHLGGRPLADRLLALKPHLKVLFLSGYTDDAIARHGVVATDLAFLQKPFSTGALAQKVRAILDQPPQRVGA